MKSQQDYDQATRQELSLRQEDQGGAAGVSNSMDRTTGQALEDKSKSRQMILRAWFAQMMDLSSASYAEGLLSYARRLDPEEVELAEASGTVTFLGHVFNRRGEIQAVMEQIDELQQQRKADASMSLPEIPDIAIPRCVKFSTLCHAAVWVAPVEDDTAVSCAYYAQSMPIEGNSKIDFFISHSWTDDNKARAAIYGDLKNAEFLNQVEEHILPKLQQQSTLEEHRELTFWLDKCCIPQFNHDLKMECIRRLDYFVQKCNGMLVLLNDRYLRRLWCIYEWASCLVHHHPRLIFIGFWSFRAPVSFPANLIINLRRLSSIDAISCSNPEDRQQLLQKIEEYYVSSESFLRFVRLTVIALVVRDLYEGIGKSNSNCHKRYVLPFLELSEDLGLHELREKLESFGGYKVYLKQPRPTRVERHLRLLQSHFEGVVYPYLLVERQRSLKHQQEV